MGWLGNKQNVSGEGWSRILGSSPHIDGDRLMTKKAANYEGHWATELLIDCIGLATGGVGFLFSDGLRHLAVGKPRERAAADNLPIIYSALQDAIRTGQPGDFRSADIKLTDGGTLELRESAQGVTVRKYEKDGTSTVSKPIENKDFETFCIDILRDGKYRPDLFSEVKYTAQNGAEQVVNNNSINILFKKLATLRKKIAEQELNRDTRGKFQEVLKNYAALEKTDIDGASFALKLNDAKKVSLAVVTDSKVPGETGKIHYIEDRSPSRAANPAGAAGQLADPKPILRTRELTGVELVDVHKRLSDLVDKVSADLKNAGFDISDNEQKGNNIKHRNSFVAGGTDNNALVEPQRRASLRELNPGENNTFQRRNSAHSAQRSHASAQANGNLPNAQSRSNSILSDPHQVDYDEDNLFADDGLSRLRQVRDEDNSNISNNVAGRPVDAQLLVDNEAPVNQSVSLVLEEAPLVADDNAGLQPNRLSSSFANIPASASASVDQGEKNPAEGRRRLRTFG